MDPTAQVSSGPVQRHHFLLRRLHSLTGIVPVGVFLIEHMLTNFGVVAGGATKFNEDVSLLHKIPWLAVVEWGFIFLPLAYHAGYGLFITLTGRSNLRAYPYGGNLRYVLQRITGVIVFIFVVIHLLDFRFAYLFGGPAFDPHQINAAELTAGELANPWVAAFYVLGTVAAVYHFANGIWTFLITWGITLGPQSQRRAGFFCAAIGVILGIMGLASLFWFHFIIGK